MHQDCTERSRRLAAVSGVLTPGPRPFGTEALTMVCVAGGTCGSGASGSVGPRGTLASKMLAALLGHRDAEVVSSWSTTPCGVTRCHLCVQSALSPHRGRTRLPKPPLCWAVWRPLLTRLQ